MNFFDGTPVYDGINGCWGGKWRGEERRSPFDRLNYWCPMSQGKSFFVCVTLWNSIVWGATTVTIGSRTNKICTCFRQRVVVKIYQVPQSFLLEFWALKNWHINYYFLHTCLIYISFSIFNVSKFWVGDKVILKLLKKVWKGIQYTV